ncbi:MAG: hypothetical protein JW881_21720 [Spirochaetales bacterium]|nr:hypothetical protein [Spirochaetales bacterium]
MKKIPLLLLIIPFIVCFSGCELYNPFHITTFIPPESTANPSPAPTPEPSYEPIAKDYKATFTSSGYTGTTFTFYIDLNYDSGNNRLVIVAVGIESDNDTLPSTAVTFDHKQMTRAVTRNITGGGSLVMAEVWYMLDNDLPALSGSMYEIQATSSEEVKCAMYGISVINVKQAAPETTASEATDSANLISLGITTVSNGAWIFDGYQDENNDGTVAPSHPDQTVQANSKNGGSFAGSTREVPAADSVTNGWSTDSSAGKQVTAAAAFAPAL